MTGKEASATHPDKERAAGVLDDSVDALAD